MQFTNDLGEHFAILDPVDRVRPGYNANTRRFPQIKQVVTFDELDELNEMIARNRAPEQAGAADALDEPTAASGWCA